MSDIMGSEPNLPHNLGLELVRATEAAAIKAGRWMGLGQAESADLNAAKAMYEALKGVRIDGVIAVSEEYKFDVQYVLRNNQHVGKGEGAEVDVVLDPIDGRTQLAKGYHGAIAVGALAPRGSMWQGNPAKYMEKIIVNQDVAPYLVPECMDAPAAWTLALVARAKNVEVNSLTVYILDRPRHTHLIAEIRAAGAHVMLRPDGDIAGALMVCTPRSGVDVLMGTGGIPEGILAACAIKALGGAILSRLDPQSDDERLAIQTAGIEEGKILTADDLVHSNQVFFAATGITDGPILDGVVYFGDRAETNSLILRSETKTRRRLFSEHLVGEFNTSV
jgi:fructose-1,6-bisphosphatase II